MKLIETPKKDVVKLYTILFEITLIFFKMDIKCWADKRTTLGAVRHDGLIPWDRSVDMGMLHKDKHKVLSLEKTLKGFGYLIDETFFGYKIFFKKDADFADDYSIPSLDIYLYKKKSGYNTYELAYKDARNQWPNSTWNKADLFPLHLRVYGRYRIFCGNKPLNFLSDIYGSDWSNFEYIEYDPSSEQKPVKFSSKIRSPKKATILKIKLTDKMRLPAQPINFLFPRWVRSITNSALFIRQNLKYSSICSYVINCKKEHGQYKTFMSYAKNAGFKKIVRMNCLTASDIKYGGELNNNKDEIAMNISHYKCWKDFLTKHTEDYILVFEDVVRVKENFFDIFNRIMNAMEGIYVDVFHFYNENLQNTLKYAEEVVDADSNITIMQEKKNYNPGSKCYLLSRYYANLLWANFSPDKHPRDRLSVGTFNISNQYFIKMKRKNNCYISPLLDVDCEN